MKNLILIGLFLAAINSFGQQTISANNLSFKLPSNLTGLKKSASKVTLNEDQRKILVFAGANSNPEKNYLGNNLVKYFRFSDTLAVVRSDYLKYRKQFFDELFRESKDDSFENHYTNIVEYDNCNALIIRYQHDGFIKYTIFTTNKGRTNKLFNATIIVSSKDSVAGAKSIDDLISSIHFK